MQGDRKRLQNELGLGYELDIRVCGRKKKCVGAGMSGGGPPWAHEAAGRAPGGGRLRTLVAMCLLPLMCS